MKFRIDDERRAGILVRDSYLWRSKKARTMIPVGEHFVAVLGFNQFVRKPARDLDLLPPETYSPHLTRKIKA